MKLQRNETYSGARPTLFYRQSEPSIFQPGLNCWRVDTATHATPLVDVRNFYMAIAEAFSKAKHSIFILGWDIDSRIQLLRGDDRQRLHIPAVASELLAWQAERHPALQIYLLRWDYAAAFMKDRELFAKLAWQAKTPPNVHICLDSTGPSGASHHQKVIVVDDEIAFTGGMDIALGRWDTSEHLAENPLRIDPKGAYKPYHDLQVVVDGPIVRHFAELVRIRWKRAKGKDAIPIRRRRWAPRTQVPPAWPQTFPPVLHNMRCGIARTMPKGYMEPPAHEVEAMYLDLIGRAKDFLYIENQFFTREKIAHALNAHMRKHQDLRALLVSSQNPQGLFEREALWGSRIAFQEIVTKGIEPERLRIVYPTVRMDDGSDLPIRVHAKCLICDDRYLNIASSNMNNRSMGLDTECDLVFEAETPQQRADIRAFRTRLMHLSTGMSAEHIERLIASRAPLDNFIGCHNRLCVKEIDDRAFTNGDFRDWANAVADPEKPVPIPVPTVMGGRKKMTGRFFMLCIITLAAAALGLTALWHFTPLAEILSDGKVEEAIDDLQATPGGLFLIVLVYVLAGLVMFPLTVLVAGTAATMGAIKGGVIAMTGALASAGFMFWLGRKAGHNLLKRIMGARLRHIDQRLKDHGLLGVAMIRMVPVAPFSLVNLGAGISSVRFLDFIGGTVLGLLPGIVVFALLGHSLADVLAHPTLENIAWTVGGVTTWIALTAVTQYFIKRSHKDSGTTG